MTLERREQQQPTSAEPSADRGGRQSPRPHYATATQPSPSPDPRAPSLRAKLEVGGADDPVERAADRAADVALRNLSSIRTGSPSIRPVPESPTVSSPAGEVARSAELSSAPGLTAPSEVERTISSRSGSGAPLGASVLEPMEQAFGADFSSVRVHSDSEATGVSKALGAKAFTSGTDIYFAGNPSTGSPEGERLLAHELAHVVQHQSSGDGSIRRKIGFELEENQWESYMMLPGYRPPEKERAKKGAKEKKRRDKGEKHLPEEIEMVEFGEKPPARVHDPTNIWDRPGASHVDDRVGQHRVAAFAKKDKLHQGDGWALEADGPYAQGRMDIEFVTEPFETDEGGLEDLIRVFGEMAVVMAHLTSMPDPLPRDAEKGQFFGPDEHGLDNQQVLLAKGERVVKFKPQVTHGVDLAQVPDLFRAFGTPEKETAEEKGDRAPAREVMGKIPVQQQILGTAPDQAEVVVNQLQNIGYIADDADVGRLTGFVTFMLTYVQCLQNMPWDGLKVALPFLSRYDFVKLLSMVPPDQAKVIAVDQRDVFLEIVEMTIERDGVKVPKREKSIGLDRPMMEYKGLEGTPKKKKDFYGMLEELTTRDWVTGILDGVDRLTPQGLTDHLKSLDAPTKDYDKSLKIFTRGHGATKTLTGVNDDKAIMENRALDGDNVDMAGARALAIRYFKYIENLENGKNSFPARGDKK